jgi:hypothetical protein
MRHKLIQIYKGDQFLSSISKPNKKKVIVFDLDETIGSFADLEILWNSLGELDFFKKNQDSFNQLLDLYPEFLRYGILNILDFLHYKKTKGHCYKLFIYTNNKFPRIWTSMIIRYLEQKHSTSGLFDQLICAFKINDVIIEPNRTSTAKTHSDLIRCSLLPKTSEICFIDDKYFEGMDSGRVYYIQPKPYFHMMLTSDIISRICKSKLASSFDNEVLKKYLSDKFSVVNTTAKSADEIAIDRTVSQKIMFHIQEFFHLTTVSNKTQKLRKYSIGKFTRRRTRPTSLARVRTP